MLLKFITTILERVYDLSRNILYDPQKCVHGRKGFVCRNCINSCENQGISFKDDEFQILENCNGCGKCIRNCKTGALQDPEFELDLEKNKLQNKEIQIICHRSKSQIGIKVNCLLNIPHLLLVELYYKTDGKLRFNKGICKSCVKDNTLIDEYINTLASFNDINVINIFKSEVEENNSKELALSREEFLLYLKNKIKENSSKVIFDKFYKEQDLVNYHNRARFFLKDISKIEGREFTESCTLCGKCHKLCPTDAIIVENKKRKKKIQYNYLKCINCNRCIDNCNQKGIIKGNKTKAYKIKKGLQCRICGGILEENNSSLLCNKCKNKRSI